MAKRLVKKPTKRTQVRKRVTPVTPARYAATQVVTGREQTLTKPQIISELSKSPHGDLSEYVSVGLRAAKEDPHFFGHLLAWDARRGQIRDAKVALPVLALVARPTDTDYVENAVAHLADLDPRLFLRALDFAKELKAPSRMTRRLVKRYLRDLEADKREWERVAVQHRASLIELYSRFAVKPADFADLGLFKKQGDGRLAAIKQLYGLSPLEAAGLIAKYRIPFLIARGALREKAKNPDLLLALINGMTATEVVTNTKMLQKWGVMDTPATRAAFEEALKRAAESKNPKASLKATTAAAAMEAVGESKIAEKLKDTQEKQLDKLKGIEGSWLVLADKSGSMAYTIETARQVSAVLTRMVKGEVHLVFFDTDPYYYRVSGKTLEEIQQLTKGISAGGGTQISCGIKYIREKGILVDGIAIVSDGEDGSDIAREYGQYTAKMGAEPTLYFYNVPGGREQIVARLKDAGLDMQTFDLKTGKIDYYSLPNLVQTMRVGRYSLLDEVLDTDLKKLDQVLSRTVGQGVINGTTVPASV